MPAQLHLFRPEDRETPIDLLSLTEVLIPEEGIGEGEPIQLIGLNSGSTNLRKLSVNVEGDGSQQVQLARDEGDSPGVWAAPGEGIVPTDATLYRGESFTFWVRGRFRADDAEDRLPFKIVFNATSTG